MYSYSFLPYAMNWENFWDSELQGIWCTLQTRESKEVFVFWSKITYLWKFSDWSLYILSSLWYITVLWWAVKMLLPVICPLLMSLIQNKSGKWRLDWDRGLMLIVSVLVSSLLLLNWGWINGSILMKTGSRFLRTGGIFTLPYMWFPSQKLLTCIP